MNQRRLVIFGGSAAAIALMMFAVGWPRTTPHFQFKVRSLNLEPSGLYDQAGAELPFVTLRLSIPELDGEEFEFSQEPFGVECKVRKRWVRIENRATFRWIQNEMSFLVLPGTEKCRLEFDYQREELKWRLLRTMVPRGVPYHQFPNRLWQWIWLKTPLGPKLITLMYHRNHFRRPPDWKRVKVELVIPVQSTSREKTLSTK